VKASFANVLWTAIAAVEILLVVIRIFLPPSPIRLSMGLSIPGLIILGAIVNAIYNLVTTGHMLEAPPRRPSPRH